MLQNVLFYFYYKWNDIHIYLTILSWQMWLPALEMMIALNIQIIPTVMLSFKFYLKPILAPPVHLLKINLQHHIIIHTEAASHFGDVGTTTLYRVTNILLIAWLIVNTRMVLLIVVSIVIICWHWHNRKAYQKDSSVKSENGLISSKLGKIQNCSLLEVFSSQQSKNVCW